MFKIILLGNALPVVLDCKNVLRDGNSSSNKKVGLALLCDNAPYTLAMTLASYGRSGLLGYFDEACAVFPESAVKVRETALSGKTAHASSK